MSLRVRLTLFYTLFLAVVLIAVATAVYAFTRNSLNSDLQGRARVLLNNVLVDKNIAITDQTFNRDTYFRARVYFFRDIATWEDLKTGPQSLDADSFTLRKGIHRNPTSDDLFRLLTDETYQELFSTGRAYTQVRLPESDRSLIVYAQRHTLESGPSTWPTVSLVALPAPTDTLDGLRNLLLRTIFFAFISFALGVWLLSNRVLLPVNRVTRAAAQVTGLDLSHRVPVPNTKDEIHDLAMTLNNMLDRLQESFETQRRFTADASHELRTPVTAIVGHANYILRRTKPSTEQIDSLTVIRREAERMAKLVNDLLELARADAGFSIQREPMNLVEVVEAVHMEVAPVAGSTNINVAINQPLIEVLGDASRLKQVVLNLVQNAVNAGSSTVTITVVKEKRQVRLEILDDGPGIPDAAIPHLFDRFYRVDGARSTRGNGSGLGLAIVNWIVQQHGGTVEVESKLGEGTVFTVLLPTLNPKMTEAAFLTQSRPPLNVRPKSA